MKKRTFLAPVLLLLAAILALSACSSKSSSGANGDKPKTVRLGIFKNITHAAGYIALENGYFQNKWGDDVKIEVTTFDNGSDFSTAMATGEIDLGFVGPGPSINQYVKSKNFRVISGSNNGGAVLVVRKDAGMNSVKDLQGKTVAIPTKGSTNEISLRLLLKEAGLRVTTDKSGVELIARAPADTRIAMKQKEVDATLISEPWATQMEKEGVGTILLDWDKIPPRNGDYPLTILVASDDFLKHHKEMAKQAIEANIEAIEFIKQNPDKSYELINNQLKKLSGVGLETELIKAAISRLHLTPDISKDVLEEMAQVSIENGFIKNVKSGELDLSKFVDTSLLEEVKKEKK